MTAATVNHKDHTAGGAAAAEFFRMAEKLASVATSSSFRSAPVCILRQIHAKMNLPSLPQHDAVTPKRRVDGRVQRRSISRSAIS
jgi:hypothetical protein